MLTIGPDARLMLLAGAYLVLLLLGLMRKFRRVVLGLRWFRNVPYMLQLL